jgi:hypothetical protein
MSTTIRWGSGASYLGNHSIYNNDNRFHLGVVPIPACDLRAGRFRTLAKTSKKRGRGYLYDSVVGIEFILPQMGWRCRAGGVSVMLPTSTGREGCLCISRRCRRCCRFEWRLGTPLLHIGAVPGLACGGIWDCYFGGLIGLVRTPFRSCIARWAGHVNIEAVRRRMCRERRIM